MKHLNFKEKPIIAVIYLAPSLGYPKHPGLNEMLDYAHSDLDVLRRCGVEGALLENENDRPYNVLASPEAITSMQFVAQKLVEANPDYPLGVEFLINDPKASLAVAKASSANFIRTDYFVDRMAREEYGGEMHIDPEGLNKYRDSIDASQIQMYTDLQVKYATMLEEKCLSQSAKEAFEHKSSAGVISSHMTGVAPSREDLELAKSGATELPIIIGSGLSLENLENIFPSCDGAIVGSALMTNERMDYEKVAPFMEKVRSLRG